MPEAPICTSLIAPNPHERFGDPRFRAELESLWRLHCLKAADYGEDEDPLANLRGIEADFGIPAEKGVIVRLRDKWQRFCKWVKKGALANESIKDTCQDTAAYFLLLKILLQEKEDKEPDPKQSER